ncbi:putative NRPS-like enzyme [Diplocarpon rosae]|nr:putative NRPS-like enzyme [Diplocarpon rosae]
MAGVAAPNYFTCTLGEAAEINRRTGAQVQTVNQLIELQAIQYPHAPAAAFPVPVAESENWEHEVFTFKDLLQESIKIARNFGLRTDHLGHQEKETKCVALLCHSSVDFLFAWLGLMRAGFSVLLIAPQCSPEAISALCKACMVSTLYHDKAHSSLASAAGDSASFLKPVLLHWQEEESSISKFVKILDPDPTSLPRSDTRTGDVAYIHHSSGTSTGIPKPIPQTHHGAVGVLPALDGHDAATFTTTPLYHGGVADCFRAWKSGALIWLFPGANCPITSKTVICSLSVAAQSAGNKRTPPVKYFSSVPYVLQMLADTVEGRSALKRMDIVGVGGAALPPQVGDNLVAQGVNLVSRFGSAECGFLLSSHRDYQSDKAWQFLRVPSSSPHLKFEDQSDGSGLSELIVLSTWPHMAKRNREDGSYATSDLFQRHPSIENAWRYDSRCDSQITLLTGKKFDPAPVEDAIKSSCPFIDDILIFGNEKQFPGAIVFPAQDHGLSEEALREEIWKVVRQTNSAGQSHSAISRSMCIVLTGRHSPLERSSKGTLLRSQAEKAYAMEIENAYRVGESDTQNQIKTKSGTVENEDIVSIVRMTMTEIIGAVMEDDADFYQSGVDSARATQARSRVGKSLPWNVVYDCGNIENLAYFISEIHDGGAGKSQQQGIKIEELVQQYSSFQVPTEVASKERGISGPICVVLTGATGGLGAHILDILRENSAISRVICLVRAQDDATACERVSSSLTRRHKQPLLSQDIEQRVWCIPVQLSMADLGISTKVIEEIRGAASHFIHAAWAVNFSLPLKSFIREHIAGLRNLINFASSCQHFEQFAFCSSTASVLGQAEATKERSIPEMISARPPPHDALGYSQSKWVAEAICANASDNPRFSGRIKILRIGQLTGDTENGVWNRSEAWPLMMSSSLKLGSLPMLDAKLSWLPVDVAARAVVDISLTGRTVDRLSVYHLVNNSRDTSWSDLLAWIPEADGAQLKLVSPDAWLDKLEHADGDPAKSLLDLWRSTYGSMNGSTKNIGDAEREGVVAFEIFNAMKGSQAMHHIAPVDEVLR